MLTPAPLRIGALTVETPCVLAPMAGFTDSPFRLLCKSHHCGLVLTEVVNAQGVMRDSPQTLHFLEAEAEERPVGAQLYGAEPEVMARAAQRIEAMGRFDLIDINCGCPVPRIISKGAGVALMRQPQLIHDMVRAIRAAVQLPVTAKTRIGLSDDQVNISEVAHAIEEAGADTLFIHARLASVRHTGPADWELLARIKSERGIPIVGNGGIDSAPDALRMQRETGVDGVMIGRAAIGNPWIFRAVHALWHDLPFEPPALEERRAVIVAHLHHLIEHFSKKGGKTRRRNSHEQAACHHFRAHLIKYLAGYPGVKRMLRHMEDMHTVDDVVRAVDEVLGVARHAGTRA